MENPPQTHEGMLSEGVVEKPVSFVVPARLPVLGLSDLVLFPGMVVPLLVTTGSSTKLIDDVVAGVYSNLVLQIVARLL